MKAKYYIGFLSALLLACVPVKAQYADNQNYSNDGAGTVINNYYMDDYDYYYSSRINRFHRSYSAFDYYSPVFTDSYWYSYRPFSWGVSIYGRSGFGFGFSFNYPVYYYGWGYDRWYDYNYGIYDPYYGSSWYWGYDPFFYSWYSPVVININIGHRWRNNYWGWYGHNRWYNDYRPEYHVHNNYYYYNNSSGPRNSFREFNPRNRHQDSNRPNPNDATRREIPGARPDMNKNNGGTNSGGGFNNVDPGRNAGPGQDRGQGNPNNGNNANNGNNQNSRTYGNNGNFGHNGNNVGNSGNNNNSKPGGNSGNFRNNPGERKGSTVPAASPSTRRIEQTAPARSYSAPARTSSPQRSGTTVSRSRSSSTPPAVRSSSSGSKSRSSSTSKSSSSSDSKTRRR